jgi:hypothetical protein
MHPKKCNFMVFNNNSDKTIGNNLKFKLYNDFIPNCEYLKFLGITSQKYDIIIKDDIIYSLITIKYLRLLIKNKLIVFHQAA